MIIIHRPSSPPHCRLPPYANKLLKSHIRDTSFDFIFATPEKSLRNKSREFSPLILPMSFMLGEELRWSVALVDAPIRAALGRGRRFVIEPSFFRGTDFELAGETPHPTTPPFP